jgi:hypothetical protein
MNSRSKKNQNKLNHAIQPKKTKACTFINPTEKKQITPTNNFPSYLFRQTPTFQRSTKIKGLYIKLANVRMKKKNDHNLQKFALSFLSFVSNDQVRKQSEINESIPYIRGRNTGF